MAAPLLLFYDDAMVAHDPGRYHPERGARLEETVRVLREEPVHGTQWVTPKPVSRGALERIHTPDYLDFVEGFEGRSGQLDPDTGVSPGSIPAMRLAAGSGIEAVEAVHAGEASAAMVLARPPGHHAERDRARGFCIVNNLAVAAAHLTAQHGYSRILVVDWDVHHGNGTQHSFEDRDDVLFFSSHRFPFFPGSGYFDEVGTGIGTGFTINVPYPRGCGDGEILSIYRELLVPVAERYAPDFVLVSAGYDAHADDPLGGCLMSDEGFSVVARLVSDIARRYADGRLVAFLEGGYDLGALSRCVRGTLEVFNGGLPASYAPRPAEGFEDLLDVVRAHHGDQWGF